MGEANTVSAKSAFLGFPVNNFFILFFRISDRGSSVSNNTAAAAAAEQFHRRFHISVDDTDSRSNQVILFLKTKYQHVFFFLCTKNNIFARKE